MKKENKNLLLRLLSMDIWKMRKFMSTLTIHSHETCWFVPSPTGHKGKVTLVAHIDTVWDTKRRKPRIFHDSECDAYWSPNGLGADDRAGVYALLRIYNDLPDEKKPNLLFCDAEETGCWGAIDASEVFESLLKDSLFFIEMDRRGYRDAVFYNDEPKEFVGFIGTFGFKKEWGTFSDIRTIGERTGLCAVNLSTGYYNEHQESEYLMGAILEHNIERVKKIVEVAQDAGTVWKNPNARRYYYNSEYGKTSFFGRGVDSRYFAQNLGWEGHMRWRDDEASVTFTPDINDLEAEDDEHGGEPLPVDDYINKGAISTKETRKISRRERRRQKRAENLRRIQQIGTGSDAEKEKSKDPHYYRG